MENTFIKNIEGLLNCPVCMEQYVSIDHKPISLPKCKHLLCIKCCQDISNNKFVNCPICREVNQINDLENMKDAFVNIVKEISRSLGVNLELDTPNDEQKDKKCDEEKSFKKIQEEISCVSEINNLVKLINKNKKKWNDIPIRIAFLGKCKVGKSTLINTLRGLAKKLHSNDENENTNNLAKTDVIQCTTVVTGYVFNNDQKILLCDVPGVGTPKHRQNSEFLNEIAFDTYDYFVLLTNDGFFEADEWLLRKIASTKKPFSFVYTKVDATIRNHIESFEDYENWTNDEKNLEETKKLSLIREECRKNIEQIIPSGSYNLYLLSGHKTKNNLYDYKEFYQSLYKKLPELKKNAMTMTLKPITDNIILRKVEILNKRIDKWEEKFSFKSFGSKVLNYVKFKFYNIFVSFLREFLIDEIKYYKTVFYIDKNFLNSKKNDEIKQLLDEYEDIDKLINNLAQEMFDDSPTITKLNDTDVKNEESDINRIFLDYIQGKVDLKALDQIKLIKKAFDFLRFVVESFQTTSIMILSTEVQSLSEVY